MSWQNEMVVMVRYLVDDTDLSSPTYSSDRVEQTIAVAAQLTQHDIDFDKTYTIDVDAVSISPDPTAATRDNAFINLVAIKAACLIAGAELKTNASNSLRVKDGPSEIDGRELYKAYKALHEKLCGDYKGALVQYQAGNSRAGEAVFGPHITQAANVIDGNF